MIRSTPTMVRFLVMALSSVLVLWVGLATAQEKASGPAFIDKGLGEEEQIQRRHEWFFSSRRAGTTSDAELWSLRLKGVTETKRLLALQSQRRASGREAEQNIWVSRGPSPSTFGGWSFGTITGRVMAIASDWNGGVLYAGSASGGLWKSTNDGLSWENIFDSAGTVAIGAIAIDPLDAGILWVGTGDNVSGCESYFGIGLLRSADGGQSWEARNGSGAATLDDLSNFASVTIDPRDPNKLVVGGRYRGCTSGVQASGGIYTTVDGGVSWTSRLANTQIHEIARDPVVPDVLWAGTNTGIFKSFDNGVSWIKQTNSGLPNGSLGRTEIAIAASDPNVVYALFDVPSDEFWRTTDGGATWTRMNTDACDGQCSYNMVIRVDPHDPDIIYRGTVRIFKSVNGGVSWSVLTNSWGGAQQVHQDTQSMLMHPTDSSIFYVGSDGGLWKSSTAGSSFENKNGNMNITQFYAIDVDANDPTRICGGAQDNSSLATQDNVVWSLQAVSGDGFICQFNAQDTNYHYITSYPSGGYPSIWRSTTGMFGNFSGITGSTSGVIGGDSIGWVTPYLVDPTNPSTLYLGTHRVYRSTNNGSAWTQVGPSNLTGNGYLRVLEINRNYPDTLYSGASTGDIWRTENSGTNWTEITAGLPSRSINDIGADPTSPNRAFAAVGGFNLGHVWEWNAGVGWVDRSNGLPNVPANTVLMIDDMDILVGMDTGIFRSTDGGESFLPFMAGLPEGLVVTDLKLNALQNVVSAGTYGRGVWQVDLGDVQPILLSEAVEQPLVEVDGDGDNRLEPGETWSVKPILRNAGGVAAVGVNARLTSSTPGISIQLPQVGSFADLEPGIPTPVTSAYQFTIDPSFECGTDIVFDLLDISSTVPPATYATQLGIYTAVVLDENEPPTVVPVFGETFDPAPVPEWDHETGGLSSAPCETLPTYDEWMLTSKDAEHGLSFHSGAGPGGNYERLNYGWLHPSGKDSNGGAGIVIPDDILAASLTVVHWYDIDADQDGANVAIDYVDNGLDLYATLTPVGDYPGTIPSGMCNVMQGQGAFAGTSGGWITSTFDLTPYKGKHIWLAFVFGSGRRALVGEGWYIDEVMVEFQYQGAPVCDISRWPGVVSSAQFERESGGTIQAVWDDSCNLLAFPEQAYSIQVGNLDTLVGGGGYSHVPLNGQCDLFSATSFTPGPGNEYYLIVPTGAGREGGAGVDSQNTPRPQPGTTCGLQRESCP
jgi:hypothetical protein